MVVNKENEKYVLRDVALFGEEKGSEMAVRFIVRSNFVYARNYKIVKSACLEGEFYKPTLKAFFVPGVNNPIDCNKYDAVLVLDSTSEKIIGLGVYMGHDSENKKHIIKYAEKW